MKGNNGPGCAWYTLDRRGSLDVSSASPGYRSSNITGMHKRDGYGHQDFYVVDQGKGFLTASKLSHSIPFDGEDCACI